MKNKYGFVLPTKEMHELRYSTNIPPGGIMMVDSQDDLMKYEGIKLDTGKPRMDLIAPEMQVALGTILAFGADKYEDRNWEKGMSWGRCFGACMRHMWAWWKGEAKDDESGESHLWHAACCIMFLIAYEQRKVGTDDRNIT